MNTIDLNKGKFGIIGYYVVFISTILFSYLLYFYPKILDRIIDEDSIFENLGCLSLFLSGLILLTISKKIHSDKNEKFLFYSLLFLFSGIVFIWAAGEEISWGQRIFDIQPGEFMSKHNLQNETNIHNLHTSFFNKSLSNIIIFLMILTPLFYRVKGRTNLMGIMLPSFILIMSFQMTISYTTYINTEGHAPAAFLSLLYLIYYFYKNSQKGMLKLAIMAASLIIISGFINFFLRDNFPSNGPREVREFFFSVNCFFYSCDLLSYFKAYPKRNMV